VATGLEHDEYGHPSASAKLHMEMEAKRRKKLQALAATLPQPTVYGPSEGDVLLVSWGSSCGPVQEAVDRCLAEGQKVSAMQIRYISPLAPGLDKIFARFKQVYVVELNDEGLYGNGQLASLLRSRYCQTKIRGINKTDGLTFKVQEILNHLKAKLQTSAVA
jgi:2-oxoglutarate ferredoxin oxidoreductase subunit alpha